MNHQRAGDLGEHQHAADTRDPARAVAAEGGGGGAQHQRDAEQEPDAQDGREGPEPRPDYGHDPRSRPAWDVPDLVQRRLELTERAGGAEEQHEEPDQGGQRAGTLTVRALDQRLDGGGALLPHEVADLADDLALSRLLAEHRAGHRDRDDQDGRQREDGVVGEGGPERQAVVLAPLDGGPLDESPDRSHDQGPNTARAVRSGTRADRGARSASDSPGSPPGRRRPRDRARPARPPASAPGHAPSPPRSPSLRRPERGPRSPGS